ncbi:UPF0489 domain containing protein [Nitzschia inconspicua]|uniref:UPF0489 domain containing protein n=1 Tax=Nitzschia inconspicua TaxID=303405 RepID=A0A9K3KHA7_9STRA|nr:UPF0489 domain containing protein [Nitzschia inconspicua]
MSFNCNDADDNNNNNNNNNNDGRGCCQSSLMNKIPVVIVESHHHVLEHVHDVLRKKKLLTKDWSMVHLDAHPDLACPATVPAGMCFSPRNTAVCHNDDDDEEEEEDHVQTGTDNAIESDTSDRISTTKKDDKNLYEMLDDTTSGIAEWILPLVVAGNLRQVEWIKPVFSGQFATGHYQYFVGVDDGQDSSMNEPITSFLNLSKTSRIKVDLYHPYYLDDNSYLPSKNLILKQDFHLQVSELPPPVTSSAVSPDAHWMLDICLDYFACHNPYIADIEGRNSTAAEALIGIIQLATAKMMMATVDEKQECWDDPVGHKQYQRNVTNCSKLLREILLVGESLSQDHIRQQLDEYFEDNNTVHACTLIEALLESVKDDETLRSMILDAIPNWNMPHSPESVLPENLEESLRLVEQAVKLRAREYNSNPFLITVARSTDDGFTPNHVVDFLQSKILFILHNTFCKEKHYQECITKEIGDKQENDQCHSCCDLHIVRDHGSWEGCTIYDT